MFQHHYKKTSYACFVQNRKTNRVLRSYNLRSYTYIRYTYKVNVYVLYLYIIQNDIAMYCWFAIYPLIFIKQRFNGHVGTYILNTIAANDDHHLQRKVQAKNLLIRNACICIISMKLQSGAGCIKLLITFLITIL